MMSITGTGAVAVAGAGAVPDDDVLASRLVEGAACFISCSSFIKVSKHALKTGFVWRRPVVCVLCADAVVTTNPNIGLCCICPNL